MPGKLVASLLMALVATTAAAQWQHDGEPVPDVPWRRSDGDFGAMLVLTKDPEGFLAQWNRPPAPGYQPRIAATNEAVRGDRVAAFVLFVRCAPDGDGSCRAEVDYRVLRPDGSTYAEHIGATLWRLPPSAEGSLQVARDQLYIEVELDDPVGSYRIEATARDLVTGRQVHLVQELAVTLPPMQ